MKKNIMNKDIVEVISWGLATLYGIILFCVVPDAIIYFLSIVASYILIKSLLIYNNKNNDIKWFGAFCTLACLTVVIILK